jgi:TolB protein
MTSSSTEQIWVADERSGGPIRQLTTSAGSNGGMDISPAYDAMIYVHAASPTSPTNSMRVAGVEKLEGDRQLFARPADCLQFNRPAWNPVDPSRLAVPCITTDRRYTIYLMTVQGKVIKKVGPPAGLPRLGDVVYSADGKRLCFWAASDADRAYDGGVLYTVSVDGGTPQALTKEGAPTIKGSDADPSYSPDGRYVAFRRRVHTSPGKPDQTDIYRVNTDGTGLVQLTKSKLSEQNPSWSPDSSQIAYKSAVPTAALPSTDQNKIFLMTVGGDNQRPLLTEGAIGPQALAAWAPR